jgi:hypothetical protein
VDRQYRNIVPVDALGDRCGAVPRQVADLLDRGAVTDATTTANSFIKSFTCSASSCKDTSAEWIAEAPGGDSSEPGDLYPLAKFAPWTNSSSAVANPSKSGNIKTFPDEELTMVSATGSGTVKAKPGALNSAGTTFGVTWENAGP